MNNKSKACCPLSIDFERITENERGPMAAVGCVAESIHAHMAGLMASYENSKTVLDLEQQLTWGLVTRMEFCEKFVAEWLASPEYKAWSVLEKAKDAIIDNRAA